MSVRVVPVPEGLAGLRLDVTVSRLFGFSRTASAAMIDAGDVVLDGAVAARSDRVSTGSVLELIHDGARAPAPPQPVAGMRVLFEDDDVVVVSKPVGVAAHPSPGWDGPTVVGALAASGHRIATSGAAERQGVVHRLDVGTSGAMVVAKSEWAYSRLKQAFRDRRVQKRYRAVVQGHPDPIRGTIDAPLDRHPSASYKFAVVAGGRPSVTHYQTLEAFRGATLLDIDLETGRTHQIRVHMAAIRHPCVGDLTYGADPVLAARLGLTRQWLHAELLGFAHPTTGEWVHVEAQRPADLQRALDLLRADS